MTLTVGYHARPTLGLQGYLTTVSGGGVQDLEEAALGKDLVLGAPCQKTGILGHAHRLVPRDWHQADMPSDWYSRGGREQDLKEAALGGDLHLES